MSKIKQIGRNVSRKIKELTIPQSNKAIKTLLKEKKKTLNLAI